MMEDSETQLLNSGNDLIKQANSAESIHLPIKT
jgi:hypothetical protein